MTRHTVNIAKFLNREGKIIHIPAKTRTLMPVLQYVTSKLEKEKRYTQPEINEILSVWHTLPHSDTLRRHLVERGFVCRTVDGRAYWVSESGKQEGAYWTWKKKDY